MIPRYFAVSTDSRVCPFKMYLNLKGVLERVTDIELHLEGWNCMPHCCSHCASLSKSFCSVSQSEKCLIGLYRIQSSAKSRVCDDTAAGKSLINVRKRSFTT